MKSKINIHDIEGAVDELNKLSASLKNEEVCPEFLKKIMTETKLYSTLPSNASIELDLGAAKGEQGLSPDGLLLAVQIASKFENLVSLDLSCLDTGDNTLDILSELNQYASNLVSLNLNGICYNTNLLDIVERIPNGIQILDLSHIGDLTSDIAVAISNTRVRQLDICENTIPEQEKVSEVWSNLISGGVTNIDARKFGDSYEAHCTTISQLKAIVNEHNADISIWENHIQPNTSQFMGQLGEINDLVDIVGDYLGVEIAVEG